MPPVRSMFKERCRPSPRLWSNGSANIPINGCGCTAAGDSDLSSRLYPGPETVDRTLGCRIAGGDHEQLLQHRFIRVDVLVVENFGIDQLLALQISVRVGEKIGI